jgi:hypothetical protein
MKCECYKHAGQRGGTNRHRGQGMISRRALIGGAALCFAAPGVLRAQAPRTLKISHQFPAGTLEQGDFRDRLCRHFVAEAEARTKGALRFEIYPGSSLMKTNAQFSALRKGALDFSLYPLAYAGGELQAMNLGLMPCLVTTYEQGAKWKNAAIGQALTRIAGEKGVKFSTWMWQAGGVASRTNAVKAPDSVKGMKIRGGSREIGRALRRLGDAIGNGRRPRYPRLAGDWRHVWRLASFAAHADSIWHDARKLDASPHHRLLAALRLCDELSAHIARRRDLADLAGAFEMGAARGRASVYLGARLFPAARVDHSDDRADRPTADQGRRLRFDLVRRGDDHCDGDGPHSSARWP